jgi:toxin ParE1/3/4
VTVRWTEDAAQDLEAIHDYIAKDNPDAAAEICSRIVHAADRLEEQPRLGREGRRTGTRELIVTPFAIVYRIKTEAVEIDAVLHGSRKYGQ